MIYGRQIQAHPTSCFSQEPRRPVVIRAWAQHCVHSSCVPYVLKILLSWKANRLVSHLGRTWSKAWCIPSEWLPGSVPSSVRFLSVNVLQFVRLFLIKVMGGWIGYLCPGVNNSTKEPSVGAVSVVDAVFPQIFLLQLFLFNEFHILLIHFLSCFITSWKCPNLSPSVFWLYNMLYFQSSKT